MNRLSTMPEIALSSDILAWNLSNKVLINSKFLCLEQEISFKTFKAGGCVEYNLKKLRYPAPAGMIVASI